MAPARLSRVLVLCVAFLAITSAENPADVSEIVPEDGAHHIGKPHLAPPKTDGTYTVKLSGKMLGMLESMVKEKEAEAKNARTAKASADSAPQVSHRAPLKVAAQHPGSQTLEKPVHKKAHKKMTKKVMAMLSAMMKNKKKLHHKVVHSTGHLKHSVSHQHRKVHPHKKKMMMMMKKQKKEKKKIHVHRLKNGAAMLKGMVLSSVHKADVIEKRANEAKAKEKTQKKTAAAEAEATKAKAAKKVNPLTAALNTIAMAAHKKKEKEQAHKMMIKEQLVTKRIQPHINPFEEDDMDLPRRTPEVKLKDLPDTPLSSEGRSLIANLKSVSRDNARKQAKEAHAKKLKKNQVEQRARKVQEAKRQAEKAARAATPMDLLKELNHPNSHEKTTSKPDQQPQAKTPKLSVVDQALLDAATAMHKAKSEKHREVQKVTEPRNVHEVKKPEERKRSMSEEEAFGEAVARRQAKELSLKKKRRQEESISMAALSTMQSAPEDQDVVAGKMVKRARNQMKSDLAMTPQGLAKQQQRIQEHIAHHVTPLADETSTDSSGEDEDTKAAAMAMALFKKLGGKTDMTEAELKSMVQDHVAHEMQAKGATAPETQQPSKKAPNNASVKKKAINKAAPVKGKAPQVLLERKLISSAADIVKDLKRADHDA